MESFVHLRKGRTPKRLHADLDGLKDDELGRGGFVGRTANIYRRHDSARRLSDDGFERVLKFTQHAFDHAIHFVAENQPPPQEGSRTRERKRAREREPEPAQREARDEGKDRVRRARR